MPNFPSAKPVLWISLLCIAFGLSVYLDTQRFHRVVRVNRFATERREVDRKSPTGYAENLRWYIAPQHHNPTLQTIQDTQSMLETGRWQISSTPSENAPMGRNLYNSTLCRWLVLGVANVDSWLTGRSLPNAVEHSAVYFNLLLKYLLLASILIWVTRSFDLKSGSLAVLGVVVFFPATSVYYPGLFQDENLALVLSLWSVLFLITALRHRTAELHWFLFSAICGGLAFWVSASVQFWVLCATLIGTLSFEWIFRKLVPNASAESASGNSAWLWWGVVGAGVILLGYVIDYFPGKDDFVFEVNHPVYGVFWVGGALVVSSLELAVARLQSATRHGPLCRTPIIHGVFGFLSVGILPALCLWKHRFLPSDLFASHLSLEPDAIVGSSFQHIFQQDALAASAVVFAVVATLILPIAIIRNASISTRKRSYIGVLGTITTVIYVLALFQSRWWAFAEVFGCVTLAFAFNIYNIYRGGFRNIIIFITVFALAVSCGAGFELKKIQDYRNPEKFTRPEIEQFFERDIAHWIARHKGRDAVVLIAPFRTPSITFFGSLKGLGSPTWENREGLTKTLRIVSADRSDEAQALISKAEIQYIVLPSWDKDLETFVRLAQSSDKTFIDQLAHWTIFDWLRPIPFQLPSIPGFDHQSVAIFEVVDEVDRATSIARLTEYFIEMGQARFALAGRESLRHYPSNLGALLAIAEVEKAAGDAVAFERAFADMLSNLQGAGDRSLLWDQKVSLAVLLTLGGKPDIARKELESVLRQIDETKLKSLSDGSLYKLNVLLKTFHMQISDPRLQQMARDILPTEYLQRLD